ncbi:hypothetical protein [Deinococcus altitudinis]|uniref:hypothetical protein n=1 Tax=Deinococcus altitudinis TaxID=468914 RepID=UPI003891BF58
MKKLLSLALLTAVLASCSSQSSIPAPAASTPVATANGTIQLSFYPATTPGLKAQDIYADNTSNVRVRISNSATGFNAVKDVAVSGSTTSTINVAVPAVDGYTVEAISYQKTNSQFLKYSQSTGVNVPADATTTVNLTLQRPSIQLKLPASVVGGSPFQLDVSGVPAYLASSGFFYVQLSDHLLTSNIQNSQSTALYGSNGSFQLNAPTTSTDGNMYVYTIFVVDVTKNWSVNGDSISYLQYNAPNVDFNEVPVGTALIAPKGNIGVGVGY